MLWIYSSYLLFWISVYIYQYCNIPIQCGLDWWRTWKQCLLFNGVILGGRVGIWYNVNQYCVIYSCHFLYIHLWVFYAMSFPDNNVLQEFHDAMMTFGQMLVMIELITTQSSVLSHKFFQSFFFFFNLCILYLYYLIYVFICIYWILTCINWFLWNKYYV